MWGYFWAIGSIYSAHEDCLFKDAFFLKLHPNVVSRKSRKRENCHCSTPAIVIIVAELLFFSSRVWDEFFREIILLSSHLVTLWFYIEQIRYHAREATMIDRNSTPIITHHRVHTRERWNFHHNFSFNYLKNYSRFRLIGYKVSSCCYSGDHLVLLFFYSFTATWQIS